MIAPMDDKWGLGAPCSFYANKKCTGQLHSYGFVINEDNGNEIGYRCRCDKCGAEIILDFDPDMPKKIY